MVTRSSLLDVAARLYAEFGWRGTTTRRIAHAAGVNEVTVFRQFGSKDTLLVEAIQHASREHHAPMLPAEPVELRSELLEWALAQHRNIEEKRGLIRACLAESLARPALAPEACGSGALALTDLLRYLTRAREAGLIGHDGSIEAAASLMINGLFMDAMTRDIMPHAHLHTVDEGVALCIDLILRGLGAASAT